MKYVFVFLLLLFLLFGNEAGAQASMNFEDQTTTLAGTSSAFFYLDASPTPTVTHELMADVAGGRNVPVSSVTSGTNLGFTTVINAPGADGLTGGNVLFGYANTSVATSSSIAVTGTGSNVFFIEETTGRVTLTFDPVLIPAGGSMFSMDFGLDNAFEPGDFASIKLEVTGCGAATTVVLMDVTGGGGGGGAPYTGPVPAGAVDGGWNNLSQNLIAYAGCEVQLVIEAQVDGSAEEFAFDNILFTAGTILPVEFLSFTANQRKDNVVLNWETANETENRGFSVERSFDGAEFNTIGWVTGNGTAETETNYEFEDEDVVSGLEYYYRLRQEDFDGAFAYSDIATVRLSGDNEDGIVGRAFPNPTLNGLSNLELSPITEGRWTVSVLDANGRVVSETMHNLTAGYNLLPLDLNAQPAGAYLVRIAGAEGTVYRRVIR